ARTLVRAGRRPPTPSSRFAGASANVMYTDMANIKSIDDVPWRNHDRRSFTGLTDPAGADSITVFNTRIGSTRNISISFHDNVFDRGIIGRAAEFLEEPV